MAITSLTLLERLRNQNDDDAWRQMSQIYQPLLRHWFLDMQFQAADVDDLVQNVLMVVCRRLPEFRHNSRPGAFRTWLRSIVVLQAREFGRKQREAGRLKSEAFEGALDLLADSVSELSSRWDEEHDQYVVRRLLEIVEVDFTPTVWQCFRMLMLEQLSPSEVAARTGVTVQAVYASKGRVMARLRKELQDWVDLD